jgi:hypothetical protein
LTPTHHPLIKLKKGLGFILYLTGLKNRKARGPLYFLEKSGFDPRTQWEKKETKMLHWFAFLD